MVEAHRDFRSGVTGGGMRTFLNNFEAEAIDRSVVLSIASRIESHHTVCTVLYCTVRRRLVIHLGSLVCK